MKIFPAIAILSSLLCLASCGEENEKGSLSSSSIIEPSGGTYDNNRSFKEKEPVSLSSLGFEEDLANLPERYYVSAIPNSMGKVDPFKGKKPDEVASYYLQNSKKQKEEVDEKAASPKSLFDGEAYAYVPFTDHFVDVYGEMGKTFHPAFYPHSYLPEQPIVSIGPAWIDGVYSHGVWSYVANCAYNVVDQTVFANMQGILAALEFFQAGDAQFDYAVYIDDSCMYFMNKSISFPNDYLDEFNKREDLHLIFA